MHLNLLDVDLAVEVASKHVRLFLFNAVLTVVEMRRRSSDVRRLVANVADAVGGSLLTLETGVLVF